MWKRRVSLGALQSLKAYLKYLDLCRSNLQSAAYQFMQTLYDSIVFTLIAYKTAKDAFGSQRNGRVNGVRALMARHGILYYMCASNIYFCFDSNMSVSVVFSANFTWAMMILFSPVSATPVR